PDLRGWMPGALSTSQAASNAPARPQPDSRGIITFPNYQVAVARQGDTPATAAARIGQKPEELARHNALQVDAPLQAGAVLALPRRVAAATSPAARPANQSPAQPATPPTAQPREHVVASGETAWSIARKYGIPV